MSAVHVVVPGGIHDVERVSGGNVYDVRLADGLRGRGHLVEVHEVAGTWPLPSSDDLDALRDALTRLPDDATVVVDGLVACCAPEVLVPHSARLRVVVLVHMPIGTGHPDAEVPDAATREGAVLRAAAHVIVTSAGTRDLLVAAYGLSDVVVAEPGTDAAPVSAGSPTGGRLVCVGAVSRAKGHDVLAEALTSLADLDWTCTVVGSTQRDPALVESITGTLAASSLAERVSLAGVRTGADLAEVLGAADLLVHPSRGETFGMVVTEAFARGLPVVASAVGGLPATVGTDEGSRPGMLVPPGDATALADALRLWLTDVALRERLRGRALRRRGRLPGWDVTAVLVGEVIP